MLSGAICVSRSCIRLRLSPMKMRSAALSAIVVCSTAYSPVRAWAPFTRQDGIPRRLSLYSTTLNPSQAEETLSSPFRPTGRQHAEGSIVSQFPGGLTAVRIEEEISENEASTLGATSKGNVVEANGSSVSGDLLGKQVVLPGGSVGLVVAHRPPVAFIYSDPDVSENKSGRVKIFKDLASVTVSSKPRIVDCFGRPIDGSAEDQDSLKRPILAPIPQLKDIALIDEPVLTGITMLDALAPIGRGQNMLMVGHDLESMRGYAMSLLQTQVGNKETQCVYATTEPHGRILERLQGAGIAENVHLVVPSSAQDDKDDTSRAAEAVAIAGTACAIGEAFALDKGMHSVVIVDTIDMHKVLWDATTRVLVDVFGVDAVVASDLNGGASSEMRGFYSSLIQRSSQYNARKGGGSVTLLLLVKLPEMEAGGDTVFSEADFEHHSDKVKDRIKLLQQRKIPMTAEKLRKIDIPVPSVSEGERRLVLQHVDDLISMSDGQIWLDERLVGRQEPPIDPQRSVTRIGIGADTDSHADAPALRRVAEGLRLLLSQAASMDGADATAASVKQRQRQQALLLAMWQKAGTGGRRLSESCAVLLAASQGFLDIAVSEGSLAGTKGGTELMEDLLKHLWVEASESMQQIDDTLDLSEDARASLVKTISTFFAQ